MKDESGVLLFSNLTGEPVVLFLEAHCDEVSVPAGTRVELHFPKVSDFEGLAFSDMVVVWSWVDQIRAVGNPPHATPLYVMDHPVPPGGNPECATDVFIENDRWRPLRLNPGPRGADLLMPPETHFRLRFGGGGIEHVALQESTIAIDGPIRRIERGYWSPTANLTRQYFEVWPTPNERVLTPLTPPRNADNFGLRVLIEPTNQSWGHEMPRRPFPEYLRATLREELSGIEPRMRWFSAVLDEPVRLAGHDGRPPLTVSEIVMRCEEWERAELLPLRPWNSQTPGVEFFAPRERLERIPDPISLDRDLIFLVHGALWPEPKKLPDAPSLYRQGIGRIVAGKLPTV